MLSLQAGGLHSTEMLLVFIQFSSSYQIDIFYISTGIDRLYALSFMWMREVATSVTIVVALVVSFLTGKNCAV